ncbi:hypothetical protein C2845_PM01G32900 [Panicum miliaceum]|uniref:Uncharacterized protein n=1 Tax=Panicum miliaceum TaxID=4540 RepID=A0A3L6TK64_PANMI|nr:hypothetical protein C2845_PM01G32900 [Panicum miliaceum]
MENNFPSLTNILSNTWSAGWTSSILAEHSHEHDVADRLFTELTKHAEERR